MSTVDQDLTTGAESQPTLERLVTALRSASTTLLKDLEGAAEALQKDGRLPTETLATSTASLRQSFLAVWGTLEEHASFTGIEVDTPGDDLSLSALESLWERIDAAYEETRRLRSDALAVATRVTRLQTTTDADAALLAPLRSEAEQLARDLTSDTPIDSQRLVALTSATHPWAALLALVDPQGDLDDQRWEEQRSALAGTFSMELATAVARGRVLFGKSDDTWRLNPLPEPTASIVPDPTPPPVEATPAPFAAVSEPASEPDSPAEPTPESTAVEADAPGEAKSRPNEPTPRRWRRRRR